MDYLQFIARLTSHIPDKGKVMIRYYGLYSNAHRGKMRKAGFDPSHPPIIEDEPDYFQIVDLVILDVLLSFVDVHRWKLRKTVRDLE